MRRLLIFVLTAFALVGGIAAMTTIDTTPVVACDSSNC